MSTKYNLSNTQIRHLAIICYREQGRNDAGVRACASHMCNYYEKYQRKNFRDVYECTFGSGWYWSKSKNEKWIQDHPDVPQSVVDAVKDVICEGRRTIPEFVDEYDCLSDVRLIINDGVTYTMERDKSYVMNRANYHRDKTLIENVYADPGDRYTFYCFPDGINGSCDAFGYISKIGGNVSSTSDASIPDKACTWAEDIAADQSHGYSQQNRWGKDYDCSSLVISAYKAAGVPIDINKVYYTGNMDKLKDYGFADVTSSCNLDTGSGLQRGDILYYHIKDTNGHTAMYCGNGKIVHARGQSYGSPATGDQGTEIAVTNYTRSQWQHVLRYTGGSNVSLTDNLTSSIQLTMAVLIEIKKGSTGTDVLIMQAILTKMGITIDIDGEFGAMTETALKTFQQKAGLTVDGVCGRNTWKKLIGGLVT